MKAKLHISRTAIAATALIGAMVADFAETSVDPANTSSAAKFYDAAANHHGRMLVAAMLLLASALLLVPGVLGVTRALRARGRVLGTVGSVLALLGAAGHVALASFYVVFATIPSSGEPPAQAVALIHHVIHSNEAKLLAPLAIAFPLAILLTLVATVRARLIDRWVLVPVVAAPIVAIVGPESDPVKTSVALALFMVAAAAVLRAVSSATPARQPSLA